MKAKRTTVKKLDKDINLLVSYDLGRITSWTQQELARLQKDSKLPICIKLKNDNYIVATYLVEKITPICWKVNNLEFSDKKSAIYYCAMMHLNKYEAATAIYEADVLVGNLEAEKARFRLRLDTAHKDNDQFKIDVYGSRFDVTRSKLYHAKKELEQILSGNAKYMKQPI
jgi:hypothetical protein